jgi:protein TonB
MSVPVIFKMPQAAPVTQPAVAKDVYASPEVMAHFPGCDTLTNVDAKNCTLQKVSNYLRSHLVYPEEARTAKVAGTVVVEFIIDETGKVKDPVVKESIGSGCDGEAVRLISSMPAWVPAKEKGKPVKSIMALPVRFEISEKE